MMESAQDSAGAQALDRGRPATAKVAAQEPGETASGRASKRRALMLRSAKVIAQAGEFVCIVRDVSDLGTSLSFLHDVPPDERMILALANGLTYPIERVWSGKRQAGYRFGADVTMDEFIRENAPFELRPIRLEIEADARTIDGREHTPVRMRNISTHGAMFESLSDHAQGRLIVFQIEGAPQYLAQICWREETRYGLRFQHPIALAELAGIALRIQPFAASAPAGGDGVEAARAA